MLEPHWQAEHLRESVNVGLATTRSGYPAGQATSPGADKQVRNDEGGGTMQLPSAQLWVGEQTCAATKLTGGL